MKIHIETQTNVLIFQLTLLCVWHGRGNILLAQDETPDINHKMSFTLQGKRMHARTFGLNVSIIDFTLSRINTGAPLPLFLQFAIFL